MKQEISPLDIEMIKFMLREYSKEKGIYIFKEGEKW